MKYDNEIKNKNEDEEYDNLGINKSHDLTNSQLSSNAGMNRNYVSESLMAKKGRFATEARMKARGMFSVKSNKNKTNYIKKTDEKQLGAQNNNYLKD